MKNAPVYLKWYAGAFFCPLSFLLFLVKLRFVVQLLVLALFQKRARATSSVINALQREKQEIFFFETEILTLQRRIGMMEPCFLKLSHQYSCMRHD